MSQIYAVVGSVTNAMRLSKELKRQGVKSTVVHTPGSNKDGCSYSLLLDKSGKELVLDLSERYKIKKIIESDSDGLI